MLIEMSSQITIMQFLIRIVSEYDPRYIQASTPEKRVPHVARAEEQVVH